MRPGHELLPITCVQPERPPLPESVATIAYWHAGLGVRLSGIDDRLIDGWQDQVSGLYMPTNNANVQAMTDGSNFRGRPAIRTSSTNQTYLRDVVARNPPYWASGQRPYFLSCGRLVSLTAGPRFIHTPSQHITVASSNRWQLGGVASVLGPASTSPVVLEAWLDGAVATLTINGAVYTAASAAAANQEGQVGLGGRSDVAADGGASWHVFHMICASAPTPEERLALRQWCNAWWGTASA